MPGKQIYSALMAVQRDLKAPRGQFNKFGNYKYRSAEDIIEAVKPLLNENGLILNMTDDVIMIGNRIYIKATVSVIDVANGDIVTTTALARESAVKKGMDDSQITGTASSYARKYALNGLFAIDDTKDADTNEYHQQTNSKPKLDFVEYEKPQNKQYSNLEKSGAIKVLNEAIFACQLKPAEVSAIAGTKIGKTSTKDMSAKEIFDLAYNLEKWVKEKK